MDDAPAALVLAPEVSVAGDPCLVRLYPMAKGRTRGNAALAVELDVRLIPQRGRTGSNSIGKRILPPWRDSGRRPRMLREHRSQAIQVWCGLNQSPLQNSIEKQSPEKSALTPYLKQRGRQEAWASSARRRLSPGPGRVHMGRHRMAARPRHTAPVGRGDHGTPRLRPTVGGVPGPTKGTQSAGTTWHIAGLVWPQRHESKCR